MRFAHHILGAALLCGAVFGDGALTGLRPISTTVSGTLDPFTVAIDGMKIVQTSKKVTALKVNGASVTGSKDAHHPFFVTSDQDTLEFIALEKNGKTTPLTVIRLPSLSLVERTKAKLIFQTTGSADGVLMDEAALAYKKPLAEFTLPRDPSWAKRVHSVEVKGPPGRPGRVYNYEPGSARTLSSATSEASSSLHWKNVSLAGIGGFQKSGGNSFTAELGWFVEYAANVLQLRLQLGLMPFKKDTGDRFLALEGMIFAGTPLFAKIRWEAGGGAQYWVGFGGAAPAIGGNLVWVERKGIFDRIFLGYSAVLFVDLVSQFRLGVGASF